MSVTSTVGIVGFYNIISKYLSAITEDPQAVYKNSYIEYTKSLRVEPTLLMEAVLAQSDITQDLLQVLLSIFSGYYLQAVAASATIGNTTVSKTLDKLNPNRDPMDTVLGFGIISLGAEQLDEGPKLPDLAINQNFNKYVALENIKERYSLESNKSPQDDKKGSLGNISDSLKEIKDVSNLAVGKMLNVELVKGKETVSVPVAVRLITSIVSGKALVDLISYSDKDLSFKSRWHGWRSGRLEFWKDIILCKDLINAHRQNLINDKSGFYREAIERNKKNNWATILTAQPSVTNMTNIVVITEESLRLLEQKINGRIDDFRTREKIFANSGLMLFTVVDTFRNRIKIYHQSIPRSTDLTFSSLKKASKDSSNNILDILNAFQTGKPPVLG